MTTSDSSLLENAIIKLLSRHEYYGHILLQLKIEFDIACPTAGVTIKNSRLHLSINPTWFGRLSLDQQVFILQHEAAHIMLGHLGEERKPNPIDMRLMNIAMDAAIHEILAQAKTLFVGDADCGPITVEGLRQHLQNDTIESKETSEYYFNFLKQCQNDLIEVLSTLDVHSWDDNESADVDMKKALTVSVLENASRQCSSDRVPSEAISTIERFKKQTVNWRALLRRYITSQLDVDSKVSRSRRNRRYGFLVPGKKRQHCSKIVAIVDTSASMDISQLNAVWSELDRMTKQGYEVTVIEADVAVQRSYLFDPKKTVDFKGRGGTIYQVALDAAMKFVPDVVIYLTDLDPYDVPQKPKFPVVWAAVDRGGFIPTFGRIVDVIV